MIVTKAVFTKFIFIGHLFVRNSYTEFHDKKKVYLLILSQTDGRTDRYRLQIRSYLLRKESRINLRYM